jgi:hypothetical protein
MKTGKEEMVLTGLCNGAGLTGSLYLHSHFLGLLLHMLNNFITSTSVITSSGRAMLFPFL